jgi:peptidylprolyl isomerase
MADRIRVDGWSFCSLGESFGSKIEEASRGAAGTVGLILGHFQPKGRCGTVKPCLRMTDFAQIARRKDKTMTESESGLQYQDIKEGTGAQPKRGQVCVVHYTGWLWQNGVKGKKFDSSVDRGQPFDFAIGTGRVIKGWDEGVLNMKVGGKRELIIPPDLAYGARGAGGTIPPNATLLFEVELLKVRD